MYMYMIYYCVHTCTVRYIIMHIHVHVHDILLCTYMYSVHVQDILLCTYMYMIYYCVHVQDKFCVCTQLGCMRLITTQTFLHTCMYTLN